MKEIYNWEEHLSFMRGKLVKRGNERTYTLMDFMTYEQKEESYKSENNDLSMYDPTPKFIKEHILFISKVYTELKEKYPNDKFLKSLEKEENFKIKVSFDWYTQYGIKK